ncbi:hypothetical protein GCM10027580_12230 [Corynebacterium faecale]
MAQNNQAVMHEPHDSPENATPPGNQGSSPGRARGVRAAARRFTRLTTTRTPQWGVDKRV